MKCQNCHKEFIIDDQDKAFYNRIQVPEPTFCPVCREQRRIAFRNERALYKRECDLCKKSVISRISPDKKYLMYCKDCWWSDKWDSIKSLFHLRHYSLLIILLISTTKNTSK